jgi:hypothetical protein
MGALQAAACTPPSLFCSSPTRGTVMKSLVNATGQDTGVLADRLDLGWRRSEATWPMVASSQPSLHLPGGQHRPLSPSLDSIPSATERR